MASLLHVVKKKRARRHKNAGHARKVALGRRSTKSYEELFADCGDPGKPAPAAQAKAEKKSA
jgi:hypothetical protein